MNFRKFSTRQIVITLFVMLISSLLGFILTNCYYHLKLKPANDERVTGIVLQQKSFIESHPELEAEDFFRELAALNFQVMAVKNGTKQFYGTPFRVDNIKENAFDNKVYHGIKKRPFDLFITGFFDNETENTVGTRMLIGGEQYYVLMRPDVGQSMAEFRIFLAWLIVLTMLFSILLVSLSSKLIVRPVVKLKEVAKEIGRGNYDVSADIRRKDEIGILAQEMEHMKHAIQKHEAANQRFVANVSHEIQSPITNLIGQIRQLQETKDWKLLSSIEHQSLRLSGLTKQLLMLAHIEQSDYLLKETIFNGKELIQEVIHSMSYQLNQKNIFVLTRLETIEMKGNRDLIFQMLQNLLSNAIKYSDEESMIEITLEKNKQHQPVIRIKDEGRGIDSENLAHIFERFYKFGTREDDIPSNGLGMSIVKEIADMHRYDIEIQSQPDAGTTVMITCHS